jgi:hypothetical protein
MNEFMDIGVPRALVGPLMASLGVSRADVDWLESLAVQNDPTAAAVTARRVEAALAVGYQNRDRRQQRTPRSAHVAPAAPKTTTTSDHDMTSNGFTTAENRLHDKVTGRAPKQRLDDASERLWAKMTQPAKSSLTTEEEALYAKFYPVR